MSRPAQTRFVTQAFWNRGAIVLDSTQPIIKRVCSLEAVPLELSSGLLLTLLASGLISAIVTWDFCSQKNGPEGPY